MGFHMTYYLSYKFRLLLLFTLCLTVVGWATNNYFVRAIQEIPKAKNFIANFKKTMVLSKKEPLTSEAPVKKADLDNCPAISPYLRGQDKLIFKPDLTLEDVQAENPKVHQGRHRPEECKAPQRVAILIPHRNRERHLMYLLEHLHPFLQRQQLDYGIYIIHQAGSKKFNRAKLLNVGYIEALKDATWDCFIFHDVDLVPENDLNLYKCEDQPKHLVVGRNSTGYRVELHRMKIVRPMPDVGKYTMIFHTRDQGNEVNVDRMKLLHQVSRVWRTDGLNSCVYRLLSVDYNPLYINITVDFWSGP
ncbi:beta-1,4-galactosyltransferase 4 isoform X2 [Saccopteryx leptura]|uniref:beta-1,4-galactosyltransferase 4 isoform X2 n=1 Tax=Saccopteryx leptura TaxID=249018 RepID=UPI00339D2DCA